jgi:flavin-dependent dehydrogenase
MRSETPMTTAGSSSSSAGGSPLRSGDTAVVIGGGPSGAFFAIHLLREAKRLDQRIDVVIVERRGPVQPTADCWNCRGCTFCAGGISPRLHDVFEQHGLAVPRDVIQEEIDAVWIQGEWKNFRLRVPAGMRMYTVFRGSLPGRRNSAAGGFDAFLLGEAVKEGARLVCGDVHAIDYTASGRPTVTLRTSAAEPVSLEASFVAVATGINAHGSSGNEPDPLMTSIRRINPAFAPGKFRKTFIFELDAGAHYLRKHMNGEIHFIEYGSPQLALEHTALIPKGRFLTVAMIGKCVDAAAMPRDGERIMKEFLGLPQINRILPGIGNAPLACACFPSMAITTARSPFGDRFALIGDAVGARLNKDGMYSAHLTAHSLALTVLHDGVDRASLSKRYGDTIRWLTADNRYGRLVFGFSRVAFGWPAFSRIMYQAFATELKVRDARSRPLGVVLWKIASGTADYREVLKGLCGYALWRSVLIGALVTLRNVVVERALGLQWGEYGRYPTVVIKEKRDALKRTIAATLESELDAEPDFERMYAIKIKGSPGEILQELGKFGEPAASYLNLRFVEVRRITGRANEVGAVVRYRLRLAGWFIDLRLTRLVGDDVLVYEVSETFARRGRLIFHISPTAEGNSRLAIYAAFDFRRGENPASRAFWWCGRVLFPGFVHDVVWNHALCCIKEEVELSGGSV